MFKISPRTWYLNKFFLLLVYLCLTFSVFWPIAFLAKKIFIKTLGVGTRGRIMALSSGRFRGDLNALMGANFTIIELDVYWMQRISTCFFRLPTKKEVVFEQDVMADVDSHIQKLNRKLVPFLNYLRLYLKIDIVISGATHYASDYLWGQAFSQVNVPFVILHRECNKSSVFQRNYWVNYWSKVPKYHADYIVVHNEPCRDMFVKSGIIEEDRCLALGALRMDKYLENLNKQRENKDTRNSLVFFSFFPGVGLPNYELWDTDTGFRKLFLSAHETFFQFLKDNPDVNGILKLKWKGGSGEWEVELDRCLANIGSSSEELSNLRITADDDVEDLILGSSAVIAFGSTTMIEALVAGKPVITPAFAEAAEKSMHDKILFFDDFDLFNVANSEKHFVELMNAGLKGALSCDVEHGKYLFRKWLGATDGKIVEQYATLFDSIIKDKNSKINALSLKFDRDL